MKIFYRMIVIYLKKIKKKMIQMNFRKKKMRQE